MHRPDGTESRPVLSVRLVGAFRRLIGQRNVVDETRCGVEDPAIQAQEAIDGRFPVESARALCDFHRELVEDGTISEQAAVTYGLTFLRHMLGAVWPEDEEDDDCD